MKCQAKIALLVAILAAILISGIHAYLIPLVGEETRYASVAWRMFLEHNAFIPLRGEEVYLHKSPLLYWFLDFGWWINTDWPWQTIIPIICAILTLVYTQKLSKTFFPEKKITITLTPLVLIAMPFFINYLALLRFDMLLTLTNLMACYFLTRVSSSKINYGLFIISNSLGLLAKGPVIYIFTIPEVLLYCMYFKEDPWKEAIKFLFCIFLSLFSIMIWWGPILYRGQGFLLKEMLVQQVLGRVMGQISIAKPIWDYLLVLPSFFFPWVIIHSFWKIKNVSDVSTRDKQAVRFILSVFIVCFAIFSLIKTKEYRYLLPLAPLIAIYIAYRLETMLRCSLAKKDLFSVGILGGIICISAIILFILQNFFLQHISLYYAYYFPNAVPYILFLIGVLSLLCLRLKLKQQLYCFMLISITFFTTLDVAASYAIEKTQSFKSMTIFLTRLLQQNIPVISRHNIILDMQFNARWSTPIPLIKDQKKYEQWANNHPNGWVFTMVADDSLTPIKNEGTFVGKCFETPYLHSHTLLKVCPILDKATIEKK